VGRSKSRLAWLGAWSAVLLLAAMFLGASGSASAAKPGRAPAASLGAKSGITIHAALARPAAPTVVLYDQYNNQANFDVTSQDFEPSNDPLDSFAADDFVVPGGQTWTIQQVDVDGEYNSGAGPAASFHAHFYANVGAELPGALIGDALASSYTGSNGDASITLSTPVTLGAGTYWVSVQARQDFTPFGQWLWQNRSVQSNASAAWQNPGGGFDVGCTTWGRKLTCIPSQVGPDQTFRLSGIIPPPPPSPPSPPPPVIRCVVPRVIGLRLRQARTRIRARHCSVGRIRRARSRRVGRVLAQSPRPGRRLARGSRVNLVVGRR